MPTTSERVTISMGNWNAPTKPNKHIRNVSALPEAGANHHDAKVASLRRYHAQTLTPGDTARGWRRLVMRRSGGQAKAEGPPKRKQQQHTPHQRDNCTTRSWCRCVELLTGFGVCRFQFVSRIHEFRVKHMVQ